MRFSPPCDLPIWCFYTKPGQSSADRHTVEDLQSFTAMHVPSPNWIHITRAAIPPSNVTLAGQLLSKHFHDVYSGVSDLGGENWWTLRGKDLEGEWIEMRKDYLKRTVSKAEVAVGEKEEPYRQDEKVILYIHGGAFFFSSLDTHRYQIQRHARKLGGRAFSPSYRLAPQYPFVRLSLSCSKLSLLITRQRLIDLESSFFLFA